MKIEKIDNNKIRCYLDKDDLSSRQIDLSELAYGTDKAKMLFHEMLEEAFEEFGFDFEGSPIMVEAIPVSPDSIILIISRVDDPEELDTRFARFAPESDEYEGPASPMQISFLDGIDEDSEEEISKAEEEKEEPPANLNDSVRIFTFKTIDDISAAARVLSLPQEIQSSLYYDQASGIYCLVVKAESAAKDDYVRVCNTLSEFGRRIRGDLATAAYYEEHLDCIIREHAIETCKDL